MVPRLVWLIETGSFFAAWAALNFQFSSLGLLSAGIAGMHHHPRLPWKSTWKRVILEASRQSPRVCATVAQAAISLLAHPAGVSFLYFLSALLPCFFLWLPPR
jgi:hypothetical protein